MSYKLFVVALTTVLLLEGAVPYNYQEDATIQSGTVKAAPTLTDLQKLMLQNKYLLYENSRLKAESAQTELLAYLKSLDQEGYTIDIGTATYREIEKKGSK